MPYLFCFIFPLVLEAAILSIKTAPTSGVERSEIKAILAELKSYGDYNTETTVEKKPLLTGRGAQLVEEAKARNRAILAQASKAANDSKDENELSRLKREQEATLRSWREEVQESLKQWRKEQEIFLGRLKIYQQNTFEIPVKKQQIVEKKVTTRLPKVLVVNGAMTPEVRDQFQRPTCAAFAGIRAMEIILAQHDQEIDLSEQYFYWASKPQCQAQACQEKGSWVTPGLNYSLQKNGLDIPTEAKCNYQREPQAGNETQVPLASGCQDGFVKVSATEEVKSLAEVVAKLESHTPVIMAAKLSENFYRNKGLVTLKNAQSSSPKKLDQHALGHAFLGVGVMELPTQLRSTEGDYCILVVNSWGKGWGAGGYGCLTENWLKQYRLSAPFVAVTKIATP